MIEIIPTTREEVTSINPETGKLEFDRAKFREAAERNREKYIKYVESRRLRSMKMLKTGVWEKKLVCRDCNSIWIIPAESIRYGMYNQDYESGFEGRCYTECPVCSKQIVLKTIPPKIAEEIKENRSD